MQHNSMTLPCQLHPIAALSSSAIYLTAELPRPQTGRCACSGRLLPQCEPRACRARGSHLQYACTGLSTRCGRHQGLAALLHCGSLLLWPG